MKENLIDINRLKRFKVKLDNRYPILEDGIIPEKYMPSYVDDVLEFDTQSSFPTTGESGKIYLTADTNKSYRWTGSGYAEISSSLALGETSATAYRGDRGKIAYDHSQKSHSLTIAGNSVSALGGTLTKETLLTSLGLSSAASDITSLKAHVANGDIHVTADDKTAWNSAVETLDTHTKDTTIHITSDERTKWNNNIANLSTHIADSTKHITASERTAWNAKWDYNEATIKAVKVNNATTADKVGHTLTFADGTTFNGSADKSIGKAQVGLDKVANKTITVTSSSVSDGTNTFNKYIHPTHSAVTIASANGRVLGNISVDSLGHVTSVGYKALGFADLPSLYIGKTKIQSSSVAQALTGISSITLEGSTAELKWDDDKSAWRLSGNLLVDGFVASGGTGSSGGSSGGAVDVSYVANLTAGTLLGTLTINGTDYQILAPSLTASSINAALGNTPVARATADAEGNSISGTYAKTSSLPTKVSQLTNDSGYLTGITKAMVESVLTGEITSHTHSYLPLSGGTLSGQLYISSGNDVKFILNNTDTEDRYQFISFRQNGVEYGYLGTLGDDVLKWNSYEIFHRGNFNPASYLPLTGGTIIGTLNIDSSSKSDQPLSIRSNVTDANGACRIAFYDSSNAFQGYVMTGWGNIILSHRSWKQIGVGDSGIWCSTDNGATKNTLIHSGNVGDYAMKTNGTNARPVLLTSYENLDDYGYGYYSYVNANNPTNSFGQNTALFAFRSYRGNDTWQIAFDGNGINNTGGPNFAIRGNFANFGWSAWYPIATTSSNVASATKLQTSRTIWGQPFDGTGNVDGRISMSGLGVLHLDESSLWLNYGAADEGKSLRLCGNDVAIYYGKSSNFARAMTINSSGNVTIGAGDIEGTSVKLYVNGAVFSPGNSGDFGGYAYYWGTDKQYYIGSNANTDYYIWSSAYAHLRIGTNGSERMRITGDGNVGIGTTSPSYKLHVNGSLRASSLTLNGTNLLEWDSDNSAWKFNGNLIATGFIASGDISAQAAALAEEEDRIAALEAQVAELQAEIENLKAQ